MEILTYRHSDDADVRAFLGPVCTGTWNAQDLKTYTSISGLIIPTYDVMSENHTNRNDEESFSENEEHYAGIIHEKMDTENSADLGSQIVGDSQEPSTPRVGGASATPKSGGSSGSSSGGSSGGSSKRRSHHAISGKFIQCKCFVSLYCC